MFSQQTMEKFDQKFMEKIIEKLEKNKTEHPWEGRAELYRPVAEKALREGKEGAFWNACFSMKREIEKSDLSPLQLYPSLDETILKEIMSHHTTSSWDRIEEKLQVPEEEKAYYRSLITFGFWNFMSEGFPVSERYPNVKKLSIREQEVKEEMSPWQVEDLEFQDLALTPSHIEIIAKWPVKILRLQKVTVSDWNLLWQSLPHLEKLYINRVEEFSLPTKLLSSLSIQSCPLKDEHVESISQQKALHYLGINYLNIPSRLYDVIDFPNLNMLHLRTQSCPFGKDSLWKIEQMEKILSLHPKLTSLHITRNWGQEINCSSLIPFICQCVEMESLHMGYCHLQDEDIRLLQKALPKLKYLTFCNSNLGDEAARYFSQMPLVESLDLTTNPITDVGLSYLLKTNIRHCYLGGKVFSCNG